jgi:hypothetical protein
MKMRSIQKCPPSKRKHNLRRFDNHKPKAVCESLTRRWNIWSSKCCKSPVSRNLHICHRPFTCLFFLEQDISKKIVWITHIVRNQKLLQTHAVPGAACFQNNAISQSNAMMMKMLSLSYRNAPRMISGSTVSGNLKSTSPRLCAKSWPEDGTSGQADDASRRFPSTCTSVIVPSPVTSSSTNVKQKAYFLVFKPLQYSLQNSLARAHVASQ